jgi:hypothetical protein
MMGAMKEDIFTALEPFLKTGDCAGGLDFLISHFHGTGDFRSLFEAKLMKKRLELGLPLIQTDSFAGHSPEIRSAYDAAMIEAAREAGTLALASGGIAQAWPYFRAIGEPEPIVEAIDRTQPGDSADQIINIAFREGVHPVKGLQLILDHHGMCQAITAFGMYAVEKGRAECIGLLVRSLHSEVVKRMANVIEQQEGSRPEAATITALMAGRDWLFGEYDYYVDTSHLLSLLPYSLEVTDFGTLELLHDLCEYGKHLSPMFQSRGQSPFDQPYVDYDEYILALMGDKVDDRIAHFKRKVTESDPNEVGTAPAQVLVNFAVRLGRPEQALEVSLEHLADMDPSELTCPTTLQLCSLAKDYDRLSQLARSRGDVLSYLAVSPLQKIEQAR